MLLLMQSARQRLLILGIGLILVLGFSVNAVSLVVSNTGMSSTQDAPRTVAERLTAVLATFPQISNESRIRRSIAQATFCLPQNILGTLLHGTLQLVGAVVDVDHFNEVTLVITSWPIGVSLGKTIILPEPFVTERYIRHEYGHTLQGYKHGPFYLLLEGTASAVQALLSYLLPGFADGYYERWPEDEADALGGIE